MKKLTLLLLFLLSTSFVDKSPRIDHNAPIPPPRQGKDFALFFAVERY